MKQLIKKIPKLGGFKTSPQSCTISLKQLTRSFAEGDTVNLSALKRKKLIPPRARRVKIVATGVLKRKNLVIEKIAASRAAAIKIQELSGEIRRG
jgi:ribosomal protein L15